MSYLSEKIKKIKDRISKKFEEIDQAADEIKNIHCDPVGYLRHQIREELDELATISFGSDFKERFKNRNEIAQMIDELIKTIENKKGKQ